jgi:hypothetical protein
MFRSSSLCRKVSAAALSCVGALSWGSLASAQSAQVTTTTTPATPQVTTTTTLPPPPSTVIVQPPPPPAVAMTTTTGAPVTSEPVTRETREEGYVPNPYLLTTGFVLWGAPYLTGVIVAAESSNSADQHLYVPIVGPWLDLGGRQPCPVGSNACNSETTNKVLLGVDGVFQAIGTLEVIWGFLRPMHREITTVAATRYTPKITFTPSSVASGYGLTALARF